MPDRAAADKIQLPAGGATIHRADEPRVTPAAARGMALDKARARSRVSDAPQAMTFRFAHTADVHSSPLARSAISDRIDAS